MRSRVLAALGLASWALCPGPAGAYVIPPEPLVDLGVGVGGGIEALTGAWTGVVPQGTADAGAAAVVQLSLRQGRGESEHSFPCPVAALGSLTPSQLSGPSRVVSFELVRDAGVLHFDGRFHAGEGAGRFSFVPSAEYLGGMSALGYPAIDAEKALTLAALDVSRRFVQDLSARGQRGLALEQLVAFRTHGVSPEFISEMQSVGYPRLSPDDLVAFRIHEVCPGFVRELLALGYKSVAPADLLNMRIHGVTPDFVRRVNASARTAVPVARLVDLRAQTRQP